MVVSPLQRPTLESGGPIAAVLPGLHAILQGVSDWNDLKYFLACSRAGSLAGAGRLLKVDQTTVSRRLTAFEQALSVRLFDRTSDGFVLTVAGEALLESAQGIEQGMIDLERRATGQDPRLSGVVRLATSETLSATFLARHLAALHAEHPEITLELVTGSTSLNLLKREADLALRAGVRPTQLSLIARRLGTIAWCAYASDDYRARPPRAAGRSLLDGHDVIGFVDELAQISPARWLADHGAGARLVLHTNSILTAHNACLGGWGVACLPRFIGDRSPTLAPVVGPETPGIDPAEIWLVVHPDLARSGRIRAVIDHVIRAVEGAGVLEK
jgi:DNA-binding transcriptional LysR family regulator